MQKKEKKVLQERKQEEKDGKICVYSMGGDYRKWEAMGMEVEDRGIYKKWFPREEVKLSYEIEPYTEKDFEED